MALIHLETNSFPVAVSTPGTAGLLTLSTATWLSACPLRLTERRAGRTLNIIYIHPHQDRLGPSVTPS